MAAKAPYVTGNYELVLDGVDAGPVKDLKGGNAKMDVAKIARSTDYLIKNQGGNVTFDDFSVTTGMSMGAEYKKWIELSLTNNHAYKSGEARSADYNMANVFSKEFKQALIKEVAFPKGDASGKEPAYLTTKFQAELVTYKKGDGAKVSKPFSNTQTTYFPSNFRLELDGLAQTSAKVSAVESLVIKQSTTTDAIGDARIYEHIPGKMEMPNLKITFNEASIDEIMAWFQTFVLEGKNDVTQEKTGVMSFLDPTRTKVLLALEFQGLGIFSLNPADQSNNEGKVASAVAEMYCDNIVFKEWVG